MQNTTIQQIKAFVTWAMQVPEVGNHRSTDAMLETAYNCIEDAVSSDEAVRVAKEQCEAENEEHENDIEWEHHNAVDALDIGFWDRVEAKLPK